MDHVINIDDINWRQRCDQRMERLKSMTFAARPQSKLCIPFELYEAVQYGDEYGFLDVLEQTCTEKELPLSTILDQVTPRGDSLLHLAVSFEKENIAELIAFHFPALLTKKNVKGTNPLHYAAVTKNSRLVKIILSQYAAEKSRSSSSNEDVELTRSTNVYGNTALHVAVGTGNLDVAAEIFHADKPVAYYVNEFGSSPLYAAVMGSYMEIVDCLLQEPFPDDKPRCQGNSPLHAAIAQGITSTIPNPALLKALVEKKPELIYLTDENGGTTLHFAADKGYVEGVLILSGKYPGLALQRDEKGYLPIHVACERGHVKVVAALLQQKQHRLKDLLTPEGENVLHVAAKNGRYRMVNYLLENEEIDINERDNNGNTPLHLASKGLFPKILFSLTQDKRIDPEAPNNKGLTALDIVIALQSGWTHRQILSFKILDFAGVKRTAKAENESIQQQRKGNFAIADWIKKRADTLILLSILIITVSFAAGFTVPGGLFSSDDDPNQQGMAVLANQPMFQTFVIFNTIAMYSSTIGTFSLFWATQLSDYNYFWANKTYRLAFVMVGTALVSMSFAFMVAVRLVVNNVTWLANFITIVGVIFLSVILIAYLITTFFYGTRTGFLRPVTGFILWLHVLISKDYETEEINKAK